MPTLKRGNVRTGGGAAREPPGGNLHRTAGHHRGCRLGLHSLQDKVSSRKTPPSAKAPRLSYVRAAPSGTCQSSFVKEIPS